ncbi:MAG: OmpA family protein, partial [Bacteroidales bacterium]
LTAIKEFAGSINTRYHEGPLSYCVVDSTMYFTRNNFNQYKKLSSDGKLNLKIFTAQFTYNEWLKSVENRADSLIGMKAKLTEKDWRNIKEFKYNSDEYSTGHPTLTADGKKMYFVSDMPGGVGGTDIYMCERTEGNDWSQPINLKEINTKGNEMFPFIHPSGTIFFASDGLPGLGGLDIFKANHKGNGFDKPENMGAPLNSSFDDFGLIADNETKTGYFSSNRTNGKGTDDLYFVEFSNIRYTTLALRIIDKESNSTITNATVNLTNKTQGKSNALTPDSYSLYPSNVNLSDSFNVEINSVDYIPYSNTISLDENSIVNDSILVTIPIMKKNFYGVFGSVFIKGTQEIVPNVTLAFQPQNNEQPITITSSENGEFRTLLSEKTSYDVTVTKQDFFTIKDKYLTDDKESGWVNLNQFINLNIEKIDLNKTIEIPNIYYDLGKWNIRKDAAIELDKVVALLNDNPNIKIELGSHTDSRGNAESNQSLSQKRAQSAVDYIISKGISKDRIVAKGYGESKLKNQCADGIKCDEKEHQQNRRTEIRVLSF